MRASDVVVLPTCCLVAATKIGRGRLVVSTTVDAANRRHVDAAALLAVRAMGLFAIISYSDCLSTVLLLLHNNIICGGVAVASIEHHERHHLISLVQR